MIQITNPVRLKVPYRVQVRPYTCGVVVAEVLLGTFGYPVPYDLYEQLGTTREDGTDIDRLLWFLNRNGIGLEWLSTDLGRARESLDNGFPVLLDYVPLWAPHVAVMYGQNTLGWYLIQNHLRVFGISTENQLLRSLGTSGNMWSAWGKY